MISRIKRGEGDLLRDLFNELVMECPDSVPVDLAKFRARTDSVWRRMATVTSFSLTEAVYVARKGDTPIGFVQVSCLPDIDKLRIPSIWVRPEFRRHGVGSSLLWKALQLPSEVLAVPGNASVWITEGQKDAEGFFLRTGFQKNGRTKPLREGGPFMQAEMVRTCIKP